MSKKLNLEDRYYINMYSRRLPCTLALRFAIDKFLQQIEITPDEFKRYGVKITKEGFECNDLKYEVEYKEFPKEVLTSMENYIKILDIDKHKDHEMLQKTFKFFKKIL